MTKHAILKKYCKYVKWKEYEYAEDYDYCKHPLNHTRHMRHPKREPICEVYCRQRNCLFWKEIKKYGKT